MLVAASVALVAAAVGAAAVGFSGNLNVLNPIGSPSHPPAADQYSTPPNITSISPTEGTTGDTITITGTAFSGTTAVSINGADASFSLLNDTTITATVPAGADPVGHITVTKPAGTSSSDLFYFAANPPANTSLPRISGTRNLNGAALALVGNVLTADPGVWTNDPTEVTFQWKDCDSSYANCTNIGGATNSTYTLRSSDLGQTVKVFVTEHNGAGDTTASNPNTDLKGNVGAPNPTADNASISGTPEQGTTLTANVGSWDGDGGVGAITFSYQWFRCGTSAPTGLSDCPTQVGANVPTDTPVLGDSGHFLALRVSGSNARGSNGWSLLTFTQTAVDGPTVSSFNPTSGAAGTAVQISGAHFTGASAVTFNGVNAATYTVNSATLITAIVPSSATTGPVSVTTTNGTGTSASSFTVLATPGITSFSPTAGGTGTTVTISGSNFAGATAVKFSNTSTSDVTVNGDGTQITTHVPTGATTGKLTVTTPAGTATSSGIFTVQPIPTITKFLPTSGVAGNTITLTGKSFTGVTAVKFSGVTDSASFNFISDTSLTTIVPDGATTGPITVTTAAGTGTSASFTIQQTPVIGSFAPTTQQSGGFVVVTGSNFVGITAVKLGTNVLPTASVVVNSATQLTLKVPTLASADYQISITNLAGTGDSGTALLHVGTVTLPPAFTPDVTEGHPSSPNFVSNGDSFPATTVTLTPTGAGVKFGDFGVTSVTFNGKPDTTFVVNGDGTITAHVPTGALTGPIRVLNIKGATAASGASFVVNQPPSAIGVSPTSGAPGKVITISGFNLFHFGSTTKLTFGSSAPITIANPGTVTALKPSGNGPFTVTLPADATDGSVQIEVSGVGTGSATAQFNVVVAPTITGISPAVGKAGTPVTITGSGFSGGTVPTVKFGANNATGVKVVNDGTLTAFAPAPTGSASQTVDVKVINDAGLPGATLTNGFSYDVAPVVTSLSQTHGPANSQMTTYETITGDNFLGATKVMFGTKAATAVSVVDAQHITAFVPAGAVTGMVKVTTPSGTNATGPTFVVDAPPVLKSFTPAPPNAGANLGCTNCITITGTNFIDKSPTGFLPAYNEPVDGVSINGVALDPGNFTVNATGTTITVSLPGAGITTGPITVSNSFTGSSTSAASLIVIGNPTITSFSPASGKPGDKITLTGTNFGGGGLGVTFNPGVSASSIQVLSNTSAIVTVPATASTGPITVSRGLSSDPSDDDFVVAQKPTLTSFDPASGPASAQATTVVDIQGTHFTGTTSVLFNGKASPFVVVNDDSDITALVPPGATTGKLTVINPAGNAVSTGLFTVDGPPVVTSITPTTGSAGDSVTINGKNLVGEMGGSADPSGTYVDFHGFSFVTPDSITSTQIQVTVPDGAMTGPLMVTDTWGQSAVTPMFTVVNAPDIDSSSSGFFNEFTGLPSGRKGQPVVIYGTGFTGTTSVRFNGTAASFQVVADWEILASVPRGATTGPITVTNAAGTASTAPRNFTILP